MKKIFKFYALAFVSLIALSSCSDSDDGNSKKTYPLTVNFTLGDELSADNISDAKLVFTNKKGNDTVALSNLGTNTLEMYKGSYKVSFIGKVTDEASAYVTGATSVDIYSEQSITLNLSKVNKSTLVFKTIYMTGGAQYYMLDGYVEIANNSDEVQYLDQLILFTSYGDQKQANAFQANGITDLYPSAQGAVVAFPGTGHDYPLLPGQFVVVANEAMNHKLAYGDDESKIDDYAKSPDLSNADWEIYLGTGDINYEAPDLTTIYSNNKYMKAWGLGVFGRTYILAKLPAGMTPETFGSDPANMQNEPGTTSSFSRSLMLPSKYVLDAVDTYSSTTSAEDHYCTLLPKDDATGVQNNEAYSGKALRRKVSSIVNGRVYYQDTNNSANDFMNNQDNTPGWVPTSVNN